MLGLVGIPIFFLELSLGQFTSSGPATCWKFAQLFRGRQRFLWGDLVDSPVYVTISLLCTILLFDIKLYTDISVNHKQNVSQKHLTCRRSDISPPLRLKYSQWFRLFWNLFAMAWKQWTLAVTILYIALYTLYTLQIFCVNNKNALKLCNEVFRSVSH